VFLAEINFSNTNLTIKKPLYDRSIFGHCRAEKKQANEKRIIKKESFFIKILHAQSDGNQVNRLGKLKFFKSIDVKPSQKNLSPSFLLWH